MGHLGLGPKAVKGDAAYLEGRVLELGSPGGRKDLAAEWQALRRGGSVGSAGFVGKPPAHLGGDARATTGIAQRESQAHP